jgi:hypothetical protein
VTTALRQDHARFHKQEIPIFQILNQSKASDLHQRDNGLESRLGYVCEHLSRCSYGLDAPGSIPGRSKGVFPTIQRPDWLWGQNGPSLLSNGYQGLFPWG